MGFTRKHGPARAFFGRVQFCARLNPFNRLGPFFCNSAQVWFHPIPPIRPGPVCRLIALYSGRAGGESGSKTPIFLALPPAIPISYNSPDKLVICLVNANDGEFEFAFSPSLRPRSRLIFRNRSVRAPVGYNGGSR